MIDLPHGSPRPPLLEIKVWDDDLHDADDPLATVDLRLVREMSLKRTGLTSSGKHEVALTGIGVKNRGVKVSFEWELVLDGDPDE